MSECRCWSLECVHKNAEAYVGFFKALAACFMSEPQHNPSLLLPFERCLRGDLTQKSLWCELTTPTTLWNSFCTVWRWMYMLVCEPVGLQDASVSWTASVYDSYAYVPKILCESSSKVGWPLFSFSSHSHLFFKPIWRTPARIGIWSIQLKLSQPLGLYSVFCCWSPA